MSTERRKRILSVSYKDDTPAFKSEAFFADLRKGFREMPSRFGRQRISLLPEDVYCFVFWTKNPSDHFLAHLGEIRSPFYVQWTISGYGNDLEVNLPPKDVVVERFATLSGMIGPDRVVWRYDPILMNARYTVREHVRRFGELCRRLAPYTRRCVISFMDEYGKIAGRVRAGEMRAPTVDEIHAICKEIGRIAKECGVTVQTCSEGGYDLSAYGIREGACIAPDLVEKLCGVKLPDEVRRPNSFRRCECAVNTDIGAYHSCRHGCKYCYAQ